VLPAPWELWAHRERELAQNPALVRLRVAGRSLSCGLLGTGPGCSPVRANLARLTDRPGLCQAVLGRREPLNWPVRRGWWPAVVLSPSQVTLASHLAIT